jgi:DNA-binding phage protein
MNLKTKKYDVANYLDSEEMIAEYLDAALESGDSSRIAEAKRDAMRARQVINTVGAKRG